MIGISVALQWVSERPWAGVVGGRGYREVDLIFAETFVRFVAMVSLGQRIGMKGQEDRALAIRVVGDFD